MTSEDIDREIARLDDEVRRLLEKRERLANMYRLPRGPRSLPGDVGAYEDYAEGSAKTATPAKPLTDAQKNHLSLIAQGIIPPDEAEGYCRTCGRPCPGTTCDRCIELRSGRL